MLTGPDDGDFQFLALPKVVAPETVQAALKCLSLRGWQIADRWALGSPSKVKAMEKAGTLIQSLLEQQKLETQTISDAKLGGQLQDVPDSEILAMHEIPQLPGGEAVNERTKRISAEESVPVDYIALKFPTNTARKFSRDGLADVEALSKTNLMLALSHVPARKTGEPVFDPELNDLLNDRYGMRLTPKEKQAAIDGAWEDTQD